MRNNLRTGVFCSRPIIWYMAYGISKDMFKQTAKCKLTNRYHQANQWNSFEHVLLAREWKGQHCMIHTGLADVDGNCIRLVCFSLLHAVARQLNVDCVWDLVLAHVDLERTARDWVALSCHVDRVHPARLRREWRQSCQSSADVVEICVTFWDCEWHCGNMYGIVSDVMVICMGLWVTSWQYVLDCEWRHGNICMGLWVTLWQYVWHCGLVCDFAAFCVTLWHWVCDVVAICMTLWRYVWRCGIVVDVVPYMWRHLLLLADVDYEQYICHKPNKEFIILNIFTFFLNSKWFTAFSNIKLR